MYRCCEMLLRSNSDVASVARHFGVSREHLSKSLKSWIEERFGVMLNGKRVQNWVRENWYNVVGKEVSYTKFEDSDKVKKWLDWCKPTSRQNYKSFMRKLWINCFNRKNLENLTEDDVSKAINWIRDLNIGTGGKRNYLLTLRSWIRFGGINRPEAKDWLEKYLKTDQSGFEKVKRSIRFIVEDPSFKDRMYKIIEVGKLLSPKYGVNPKDWELIAMLKISVGIRTGDRNKQRELWGLRVGKDMGESYVYRYNGNIYMKIKAKKGEWWDGFLFPERVKALLMEAIETKEEGEFLIKSSLKRVRKVLKESCKIVGVPPLRLHDLRHVYATWYILSGMKMEHLAGINVGWKDLNTLRKIYLEIEGYELAKQSFGEFEKRYF